MTALLNNYCYCLTRFSAKFTVYMISKKELLTNVKSTSAHIIGNFFTFDLTVFIAIKEGSNIMWHPHCSDLGYRDIYTTHGDIPLAFNVKYRYIKSLYFKLTFIWVASMPEINSTKAPVKAMHRFRWILNRVADKPLWTTRHNQSNVWLVKEGLRKQRILKNH